MSAMPLDPPGTLPIRGRILKLKPGVEIMKNRQLPTLLFPFISNDRGFDTGLAISSSSTDTDPFAGVAGQFLRGGKGSVGPGLTIKMEEAGTRIYRKKGRSLPEGFEPGCDGMLPEALQDRFYCGHTTRPSIVQRDSSGNTRRIFLP